ncbi:MAG TPA: GNAT family N-acetyltransferase, partial [Thermoanaerobaculia bacterium]|nr:GNAT family N-acetyltransferase [Thermoanaerobaculia bacterium]
MSRPPPEIRDYRPGDEEAIDRAFRRAFGAGRSLAEWAWKFPAGDGGREHVVVAVAGGEVVAHFAAQPVAVQVDGRILRAGHSVDAFAPPRPG